MENFDIFARRLKELRHEKKQTQKQFADAVGFTQATLSAYENKQKKPSLDIVLDIADKCNVSLDWLFGLSDRKEKSFEPKTYSDIMDILSEINKVIGIWIEENQDYEDAFGIRSKNCGIHIQNIQMEKYLQDWAKYLKLKYAGTIDDDIYQACMTKLKKESNTAIKKEELPFN